MSGAKTPYSLSKVGARRIWLRAQRLDSFAPFGRGAQSVADAVAHLGYVQIDTINVVERCHHHILWSRMPRLSTRRSAASPERRQERVRILDARAVLRANRRSALLHSADAAAQARA